MILTISVSGYHPLTIFSMLLRHPRRKSPLSSHAVTGIKYVADHAKTKATCTHVRNREVLMETKANLPNMNSHTSIGPVIFNLKPMAIPSHSDISLLCKH